LQNLKKIRKVNSYLHKGEAIGSEAVMEEREGRDEVP